MQPSDRALDAVFTALGHATRRAILAQLARGPTTVTAVAAHFPVALNTVSKHLKVLEAARLVAREVVGREHRLSLDPAPLGDALQWAARQAAFLGKASRRARPSAHPPGAR
jgi:DNA-binding transcriptional ArsR family regulator